MSCAHCLRGDAQNVNIKREYIDALFSRISNIGSLTLSGGEPFLVPELVRYAIDSAIKHKVEIDYIYIATNGKAQGAKQKELLEYLKKVNADYTKVVVVVSTSMFHERIKSFDFYLDYTFCEFYKDSSYAGSTFEKEEDLKNLVSQGRAKDNFGDKAEDTGEYPEYILVGAYLSQGMLNLNTNGSIFKNCIYSYETYDKRDLGYLCEVTDDYVNKIEEDITRNGGILLR
jgi:organic radical activating enzyme